MIHILLTVKKSERFPGKNKLLWPYSRLWLAQEMLYLPDRVECWWVGDPAEIPADAPPLWQVLDIKTGSHRGDIEEACRHIAWQDNAAKFVLIQLTQPLRSRGLLRRAVTALDAAEPVVSVTYRRPEGWRIPGSTAKKSEAFRAHVDGQIYAWKTPAGLDAIFDSPERCNYLDSCQQALIADIDYPADLPPNLPGLAGALLTR